MKHLFLVIITLIVFGSSKCLGQKFHSIYVEGEIPAYLETFNHWKVSVGGARSLQASKYSFKYVHRVYGTYYKINDHYMVGAGYSYFVGFPESPLHVGLDWSIGVNSLGKAYGDFAAKFELRSDRLGFSFSLRPQYMGRVPLAEGDQPQCLGQISINFAPLIWGKRRF